MQGNEGDLRKNLTMDESLLLAIVCNNNMVSHRLQPYNSSFLPHLFVVLIDNFQHSSYILDYVHNVRMDPTVPILKWLEAVFQPLEFEPTQTFAKPNANCARYTNTKSVNIW